MTNEITSVTIRIIFIYSIDDVNLHGNAHDLYILKQILLMIAHDTKIPTPKITHICETLYE